jgi:Domain of unknown function (DUF4191)
VVSVRRILRRMANDESKRSGRIAQIRSVYRMAKKSDPRIGLIVLGVLLAVFALFLVIGFVIGHPILLGIFGFLIGFLLATIVFGRRAERAAFSQVEGQTGAAMAVLNALRRGWTVTAVVAAAPRTQDVVHRAVGRPGVVLVAEGNPNRVTQLVAGEKRRLGRLLGDVPVYDFVVGDGPGQVPLRRLQSTMVKLPRNLRKDQVVEVNNRLRALGDIQQKMMPKGPIPKNIKLPRGPKLK